jgi:hypothetical protein
LRKVAHGVDPAEERRLSAKVSNVGTTRAVATDYLERYAKKNTRPGTFKETKRTFDVDVLPAWGSRPIGSITRRDAGELLDAIISRGAEVHANRTLTRLKTFFRWALDEEVITASPVARMRPLTRETSRDRALSDDEIRFFWWACDEIGWPFGPLFKIRPRAGDHRGAEGVPRQDRRAQGLPAHLHYERQDAGLRVRPCQAASGCEDGEAGAQGARLARG